MVFGWDSVARDGYRNAKAGRGRKPKKSKGCVLALIAGFGSLLALGNAVGQSIL